MTESNPSWMEKVEKMAQEASSRVGCFLYDMEFVGIGKGRTLRLFIDKETPAPAENSDDGHGAGIDDCANVSRALNEMLDAEDIIPGEAYNLEVSTPGLDRILRKPWHFEKAVGKKIWVKTRNALETYGVEDKKWKAAKQIEDELLGFDGEILHFKSKGVDLRIPFSAIEKSKVVFVLTKGQKK